MCLSCRQSLVGKTVGKVPPMLKISIGKLKKWNWQKHTIMWCTFRTSQKQTKDLPQGWVCYCSLNSKGSHIHLLIRTKIFNAALNTVNSFLNPNWREIFVVLFFSWSNCNKALNHALTRIPNSSPSNPASEIPFSAQHVWHSAEEAGFEGPVFCYAHFDIRSVSTNLVNNCIKLAIILKFLAEVIL